MSDNAQSESEADRRYQERIIMADRPHIDGLARGTVVEYDGWQWGVVTEIAEETDPTKVGFVLVDELGDCVVRDLEAETGCWEHFEAVRTFRDGEHEYWTPAEYIQNGDAWEVLGPIHPDARDDEKLVTDGGEPEMKSIECPNCGMPFDVPEEADHWSCDCGASWELDPRTDGGRVEGDTEVPQKDWIESLLESLGMVEWDRFVRAEDDGLGVYFDIYGWIDREEDAYKDFILLRVFPETDENMRMFTTSSDRYHAEINEILFGESAETNHCQRVEHTFEVPNVVELDEREVATDGGCVEADAEIVMMFDNGKSWKQIRDRFDIPVEEAMERYRAEKYDYWDTGWELGPADAQARFETGAIDVWGDGEATVQIEEIFDDIPLALVAEDGETRTLVQANLSAEQARRLGKTLLECADIREGNK